MFAAYYKLLLADQDAGKSGKVRPTAAMMANITLNLFDADPD